MHLAHVLRTTLPHLNVTQHAECFLSEHRLAELAHTLERRQGQLRHTTFGSQTHYFPYYAARPVAPHMTGERSAGFLASTAWGASVAVSFFRNELPSLTAYWHLKLMPQRPLFPTRQPRPMTREAREETPVWREALPYLPYLPAALSGYELLVGTGYTQALPLHRGPAAPTLWETLRGPGLLGLGVQNLTRAADDERGAGAQTALLCAAWGLQLALQVARLPAIALIGVVAGCGAIFGGIYGLTASCMFAYRNRTGERPISAAEAVAEEERQMRRRMMQMQDDVLPAPLIEALWQGRMALAPNVNFYSNIAQQLGHLVDQGRGRRFDEPAFVARPRAQDARPFAADRAPNLPDDSENVHAPGRDEACRKSMSHLFATYPHVDTATEIAAISTFLRTQETGETPLSRRHHESGQPLLDAARLALTGEAGPRGTATQFWPAITAHTNTLYISPRETRPTAQAVAVMWHALSHLQPKAGETLTREALILERREAFICALAKSIDDDGHRVCANGATQHILASCLQGCVPGVKVEDTSENAPRASLAQYVTYITLSARHELGEEPSEEVVRQKFDELYDKGCKDYPSEKVALADNLRAVAQLYDVEWTAGA